MGSDLTAFQVHFAVEGRSVALSFVRFRHYRLRLTAGLEEDDLVSVLDGVNDLDLRSSRVFGDSITVWLNTFILVEPHFYSDIIYSTILPETLFSCLQYKA